MWRFGKFYGPIINTEPNKCLKSHTINNTKAKHEKTKLQNNKSRSKQFKLQSLIDTMQIPTISIYNYGNNSLSLSTRQSTKNKTSSTHLDYVRKMKVENSEAKDLQKRKNQNIANFENIENARKCNFLEAW